MMETGYEKSMCSRGRGNVPGKGTMAEAKAEPSRESLAFA